MIFASCGSESFAKSLETLKHEAIQLGIFRKVVINSINNDTDFINKHWHFISTHPRGFGYWIWKSYYILKSLENECDENEGLLYMDAGCTFGSSATTKIPEWIKMADNHPGKILAFRLTHPEFKFNKKDTIHAIFPNVDEKSMQMVGGINIFINTHKTREFVKEWHEWCIKDHYQYVTDVPSIIPNHPNFYEHRHDQAIFSLLVKKYNILNIADETYPINADNAINASRRLLS
jgi:hypothetical protein